MSLELNYSVKHQLQSSTLANIGTLTFFKKFVFVEINEGAHLGFIEMEKIHSIASYHFADAPYAYVCNRNTSYSINPIAYSTLNNIEQLKGMAIIKHISKGFDLGIEKHFLNKPFEVFNDVMDASDWIDSLI